MQRTRQCVLTPVPATTRLSCNHARCNSAATASSSGRPAISGLRVPEQGRPLITRLSALKTDIDAEQLDDCDENMAGDYCALDENGKRMSKRTIGEMENDFLLALSSWCVDRIDLAKDIF